MIEVKMMPLLAKRAASRKERLSVDYRDGITPEAIVMGEGFSGPDLEPIVAIVNGTQVELQTPLKDGDNLELIIGIAGG